jgi:hypothetical protein
MGVSIRIPVIISKMSSFQYYSKPIVLARVPVIIQEWSGGGFPLNFMTKSKNSGVGVELVCILFVLYIRKSSHHEFQGVTGSRYTDLY